MFYKLRYSSMGSGSSYNLIVESEKEFELKSLVFLGYKPIGESNENLYIKDDAVSCFVVGKLEELEGRQREFFKEERCIIGTISCPEYDKLRMRKEKVERMAEIRAELEEKAKVLEKEKLYAFYASQDEEFAQLLSELKELKNNVK